MVKERGDDFKKRILNEMTVKYGNALEKNFQLAKQFIRITSDGKVDVQYREELTGQQQILLYLIGKLYAKEGGLADTDEVGNRELMSELGIPEGSLLPWLKKLRDKRTVKQTRKGRHTYHGISWNVVEKVLSGVEKRVEKSASKD